MWSDCDFTGKLPGLSTRVLKSQLIQSHETLRFCWVLRVEQNKLRDSSTRPSICHSASMPRGCWKQARTGLLKYSCSHTQLDSNFTRVFITPMVLTGKSFALQEFPFLTKEKQLPVPVPVKSISLTELNSLMRSNFRLKLKKDSKIHLKFWNIW